MTSSTHLLSSTSARSWTQSRRAAQAPNSSGAATFSKVDSSSISYMLKLFYGLLQRRAEERQSAEDERDPLDAQEVSQSRKVEEASQEGLRV